jgi:hypothetical protein
MRTLWRFDRQPRAERQMRNHVRIHKAEGVTALSISELLLLALTDLKIISEKGKRDVLMDVATTHTGTGAA